MHALHTLYGTHTPSKTAAEMSRDAKLASFALKHLDVALDKTALFGFGPNATERMRQAYEETPTQVYNPPPTRGAAGSPYRSATVVNPVNQADAHALNAASNLAEAAPARGGFRGALDHLTGKRVDQLRAAEDHLHSVASRIPHDALKSHQAEISGAISGAEKLKRLARGGVAALGAGVVGGTAAATKMHHDAQAAKALARSRLLGGTALGLGLGGTVLGVKRLMDHNNVRRNQPPPDAQTTLAPQPLSRYIVAGNFSDWNPYGSYVQGGMQDGLNATAAYMMLAAGPPRLANIGGAAGFAQAVTGNGQAANQIVLPMGLVQNFNIGQNRNFARMFEFGSERSYFIAGRTVGQLSLGRVYYHGSSLLRLLYAYFQDLLDPTLVPAMFPNAGALATPNPHDVQIPPGYDNIFINLASDLFAQPIGLMIYMRDSRLQTLGAMYVEHVVIPSHSWGSDAQGVLIQEQVNAQYERIVPVSVAGVALITSNTAPNASGANTTFPGIPGS